MHEISLCQAIIKIIDEILVGKGLVSVKQVEMLIGPLSGVDIQLLKSAFKVLIVGTRHEGSELIIKKTAIKIHCNTCNTETQAELNNLTCPNCTKLNVTLVSGDEFIIESVNIVQDPIIDIR